MKQIDYLNKIKKYLSWYQYLVKINTSNNEYDINVHSETIFIPILNIIFNSDFSNANYESKNADSVDLIDIKNEIAIQVTSTSKIIKINTTLEKLSKSKKFSNIKKLFIFILTEKQSSYSQESINKNKGKLQFDVKNNIIDPSDIYNKIKELNNLEHIKHIALLLEQQFEESSIPGNITLKQFDEFKNDYRKKCLTNFSRLNFFGLSISKRPREVDLYSLFVPPTFTVDNSSHKISSKEQQNKNDTSFFYDSISDAINENIKDKYASFFNLLSSYEITNEIDTLAYFNTDNKIEFKDLYSKEGHLVILGNPGAGKSSMIKYSISKILEEDRKIFEDSKIYELLPFRIELHKYNQVKNSKSIGILKYLQNNLSEEYQIDIHFEAIQSIIRHFPTLIFFDGLDEIFDIQERIAVRNDIENYIKENINSKVIVTSRFESYEEVYFKLESFNKIVVNNFNDKQVEEYVGKWYSLEESNESVRENEINNCLNQLKLVDPELKYNPLLLSLILILYRNELEIPTSKLEIYEGCTHTIIDTRDTKEKKLKIHLKVGNKVSIFSSLAYWQFTLKGKNQNHNYTDSHNHIKKYLINKNEFEDEHLASEASTEFLDFAKVRSIYIENKFTHKTFLEYFTAYYIYSNFYSKPANQGIFKELIKDNIGKSSWAVVIELLICKIDSQMIDSEVIDNIIEEQVKLKKGEAILFFLQIIKYLKNVSKEKIRLLIYNAILSCFNNSLRISGLSETIFNHLVALYNNDIFQPLFNDSFSKIITDKQLKSNEIVTFSYEFSIVTNTTNLLRIIKDNSIYSNSEYNFILSHYPNILNEDAYLNALSEFISTYEESIVTKVYTSPFNQKLFYGSNKFNWCITFLFRPKTSLTFNTSKLLKSGIKYPHLINSALKESAIINLSHHELKNLSDSSKDAYFKKFIKNLIKTYYSDYFILNNTSQGQFYDKFFQDKKKRFK